MTSNYFNFFPLICVGIPPGGAVLFFSASLVLLIRLGRFLLRGTLLHHSAAFDCIVMRHFRKLSPSAVSGLDSHSRCRRTPPTSAIGHSVCGFSLRHSKKATATPSKHHPPVAACRNPRGKTFFARIEGMICLECRTNE